jgi:hypothetical protein
LVATVATVLAAGGGAYAATSSGQNANGHGATAVHGSNLKGGPSLAGWAVVNSNGTFARGKNVVSTSSQGVGRYQVIFTRRTVHCAYEATIGQPGTGTAPGGEITTATRSTNKHGVWIATYNDSGGNSPRPFHLALLC